MKLFIVEDGEDMRDNIRRSLEEEKYVVETANNYDDAKEKLGVYEYDCVLLDIGLPGGSGIELLKELKKEGRSDAVLIVSAKNSTDDKVQGLNLGVDDYLAKPFHFAELHARIKSILRRKVADGAAVVTVGNVSMDMEKRTVHVNGKDIGVNRKEYDIFFYLVANKNCRDALFFMSNRNCDSWREPETEWHRNWKNYFS